MSIIVDSQVHAWRKGDADTDRDPSGRGMEGPDLERQLDAAGVDSAIVVSPNSIYGLDSQFALATAEQFPHRFRAIGPVDLKRPDVVEFVSRWADDERTVGLRLVFRDRDNVDQVTPANARAALASIQERDVPLCIWAALDPGIIDRIATHYPELPVIIDHTGVDFSSTMTGGRLEADGSAVLALARCPNVSLKLTGVPALSAEDYPYRDVWPWVERLVTSFGPDRIMWGTDWTRVRFQSSYTESLGWVEESGLFGRNELSAVLGGTARRVFGWPEPS